jgi:DNA-binding NtrC family response regulator
MSTTRSENQRSLASLVAESSAMQGVVAAARRLATNSESVFIDGETGTGRKLLARVLHEEGPHSYKPLVSVRCDMLTVDVLDRTLLGDSRRGMPGKLEEAADGTLLLVDLDALNPVAQERLVSLLDNGTFMASNGDLRRIACRLICTGSEATIVRQIKSGHFSDVLYRRMSAQTLHMPSLAQRTEDIPRLVVEVLQTLAQRERIDVPKVPYHYMELLMNVAWPENVRQLRNHVESVMVLSGGVFDPEIIREHFATETSPATIKGAVQGLWNRLRGLSANPTLAANHSR